MLKKATSDRFWRFMPAPIFALISIGVIVYDTNTSINIFYAWSILIAISYLLSILILRIGYDKYSSTCFHSYFAENNMFSSILISWPYFIIPFYGLFITSGRNYFETFIPVFIVIMCSFFLLQDAIKRMKNNFSSFYYEINGKIFFDQHVYKKCNHTPKIHIIASCLLLAFTAIQGLSMRSFHHPFGYAITIWWALFTLSFLLSPYMIRAIHAIFIHSYVEKRFSQRLLSDNWGFFELDPELAAKFFGPGPLKKRPIEYEEVFPTKEKN